MLGVRTAAYRDLDEAEIRAAQAEAACDGGRELREDLARLDGQARVTARGREAERTAWATRPDVVAARREADGNDLVRAAIAAGDFRLASLATVDLPSAREALLRREEEKAQREEALVSQVRPRPAREAPPALRRMG